MMGSKGKHETAGYFNLDATFHQTTDVQDSLKSYSNRCASTKMCLSKIEKQNSEFVYGEENNNKVGATSEDMLTEESSCDEIETVDLVWTSPGPPSLVAKEANSLIFQWEPSRPIDSTKYKDISVLYCIEIQQVEFPSGRKTPDKNAAINLVNPESWFNVCSVTHSWAQVRNLKPGKYYAVRVFCQPSLNSELSYGYHICMIPPEPSPSVIFHTTATAPITPLPPCLADREVSSLKFKWTEPVETGGMQITEYKLQISSPSCSSSKDLNSENDDNVEDFIDVYSGPELTFTVCNLEPGLRYAARVKALNEIGESPWSACSCFKTKSTSPQAPEGLTIEIISPYSVLFQWQPCLQRGRRIENYQIEVCQVENHYIKFICSGKKTLYEIKRLDSGQEYAFRVRAENEVGKSPWSQPININLPMTVPEAPPTPIASKIARDFAVVTWQAPVKTGGSPVLSYCVEMIPISRAAWDGQNVMWRILYPKLEANSCVINDLLAGCSYQIRVKAENEIGLGESSKTLIFTTLPGIPEKPQIPTARDRSSRSMNISWGPPRHDGGMTIGCYRLDMCPAERLNICDFSQADPFILAYNGPKRQVELSNLRPGVVYVFRVMAINGCGSSDWSDMGYESTKPEKPCAPEKLQVISRTSSTLRVQWEAPENQGSTIFKYSLEISELKKKSDLTIKKQMNIEKEKTLSDGLKEGKISNGSLDSLKISNDFKRVYEGKETEFVLCDLKPSTSYQLKVSATNACGNSDWSKILTVATQSLLPLPPRNLTFNQLMSSGIVLSWEIEEESTPADYYIVESCASHNNLLRQWVKHTQCTKTTKKISALLQGCSYKFRVSAGNSKGCGLSCEPIIIHVPIDIPPPPTQLQCMVSQGTNIRIKWSPPSTSYNLEDDNCCSITYKLQVGLGEEGDFEDVYVGAGLSYQMHNLEPLSLYRFRAAASNKAGQGEWTSIVSISTKNLPPPCPSIISTQPIMHIADYKNIKLKVIWSKPKYDTSKCASIYGYEVEANAVRQSKQKKRTMSACRVTAKDNQCILNGFKPNSTYTLKIRSTAEEGNYYGSWSEPLLVTIPALEIRYPISRGLSEISGNLSEISSTSIALSGSHINSTISSSTTDSDSVCLSTSRKSLNVNRKDLAVVSNSFPSTGSRNFHINKICVAKAPPQHLVHQKSKKAMIKKIKSNLLAIVASFALIGFFILFISNPKKGAI